MTKSDKFFEKLSHMTGLLPIGALFGLLAFVANVEIKDLDLWLHIGVGRFIWQHQVVPAVDILSCSIAGTPWINHEWLFQVIVYNIFEHFGPGGLLRMQAIIVCITTGILLLLGYSKNRQLFIAFLLFLVFVVFQQRFTLRPDIFSLLFFAVYIYILALHIDKKWAVPALIIVQVLWSNIHGFFFLGPLFIMIGLVSEWLKRHVPLPWEWNSSGRLSDAEYKRLGAVFVLVLLACLANPYFIKGAWYPLGVLFSLSGENRIFFDVIQELQKPITWETFLDTRHFIFYKVLILLSFVSFIFNRRHIDVSALIFWIIFLIFSLQAVRNAIFFAFAAYLVIMTNAMSIRVEDIIPLRFTEKKFQHLTGIVFKVLFLLFLIRFGQDAASRGYYDFEKFEYKSEYGGISQQTYPDKAVDFLVENKIRGNIFNDFNSGAYLVGRTFPDIRVYIDGRTEVYGGQFFRRYQRIWAEGDGALFEEEVARHGITIALLNASRQHLPKEFLNYIYRQKDWALVYFDYDGLVFLKRIPEHQKLIEQYEIDLARWQAREVDLIKLGYVPIVPYQHFFRAFALNQLGLLEPALSEIRESLRITPNYGPAYHLLGQIYIKQERFEEAYKNLRIASVFYPGHKQIKLDLAVTYFEMGVLEKASVLAQEILRRSPRDLGAHFLLAEVHIKERAWAQALGLLQQAVKLRPRNTDDILAIGDQAFAQKEYDHARAIYQMAFQIDEVSRQAHIKLARTFKEMGDVVNAREHIEKVLALDPDNDEAKKLLETF